MSNLSLEKRILYSNAFCKYREKLPNKLACRHPYSFGICDLDLCPIVQPRFANIVFLPEGITLVIKEPSTKKVAGEWKKYPLEITLDNEEEITNYVQDTAKDIPEKNMKVLLERLHRIYERYRFLKERDKEIPIIEEVLEEKEIPPEEEEIGEEEEILEGEVLEEEEIEVEGEEDEE